MSANAQGDFGRLASQDGLLSFACGAAPNQFSRSGLPGKAQLRAFRKILEAEGAPALGLARGAVPVEVLEHCALSVRLARHRPPLMELTTIDQMAVAQKHVPKLAPW